MKKALILIALLTGCLAFGGTNGLPNAIDRFLSLYVGGVQGTQLPAVLTCEQEILASPYVNSVLSVFKKPSEYPAVTHRNLNDIAYNLGPEFQQTLDGLPMGSMVILPGGGLSIYGLEIFRKYGHHVAALSAQPHFTHLKMLLDVDEVLKDVRPRFRDELVGFDSILNLKVGALNRLSEFLAVKFPDTIHKPEIQREPPFRAEVWAVKRNVSPERFAVSVVEFVLEICKALHAIKAPGGSFDANEAVAQGLLPDLPDNMVDLFIDVADAVTYSSDRLNLLSLYHQKLEPGRRAFISIDLIFDYVRIQPRDVPLFKRYILSDTGEEPIVALIDYLTIKNPGIFRYSKFEYKAAREIKESGVKKGDLVSAKTLIIEKKAGDVLADRLKHLKARRFWVFDRSPALKTGIPIVEYVDETP